MAATGTPRRRNSWRGRLQDDKPLSTANSQTTKLLSTAELQGDETPEASKLQDDEAPQRGKLQDDETPERGKLQVDETPERGKLQDDETLGAANSKTTKPLSTAGRCHGDVMAHFAGRRQIGVKFPMRATSVDPKSTQHTPLTICRPMRKRLGLL